jgi:hypothetical protein
MSKGRTAFAQMAVPNSANFPHLSLCFCMLVQRIGWGHCIGSNFWKVYLVRISFTLGEPNSLVKVVRLFRLERIVFGVPSVDTVARCTTSLPIGRASVFVMPCFYYFAIWTEKCTLLLEDWGLGEWGHVWGSS